MPIQMALQKTGTEPVIKSDPSYYAIALLGLDVAKPIVQPEAWLKPNGRGSIPAAEVKILRGAVVFLFPRLVEIREPIVFRLPLGVKIGNEIEFQARIGSESIREKFSLGAMTYLGQLEL